MITDIVNTSLLTGSFPAPFKTVIIYPILKIQMIWKAITLSRTFHTFLSFVRNLFFCSSTTVYQIINFIPSSLPIATTIALKLSSLTFSMTYCFHLTPGKFHFSHFSIFLLPLTLSSSIVLNTLSISIALPFLRSSHICMTGCKQCPLTTSNPILSNSPVVFLVVLS